MKQELLTVVFAEYVSDYNIFLKFNDGYEAIVDLKDSIFNDRREIFLPLRKKKYFKDFSIKYNTICWKNEADFAPEYLCNLQPVKVEISAQ